MAREHQVSSPQALDFDGPVDTLKVRLVGGAVNIVGSEGPGARLEITEIDGPPLEVTHEDGQLTVTYEDMGWKGFLQRLERKGWRRRAVVSLAVPEGTRVEVGVVTASAVVSGITGRTDVRGVSGDATITGIAGDIRAETVSGNLDAQGITGDLRFSSVSGALTVVDGALSAAKADSVSGDMVLDLAQGVRDAGIRISTVSGDVALRLPESASLTVDAGTASGAVSNAFDELQVNGAWGAKNISGRLGDGKGKLGVNTVSGAVALLRRPPVDDGPPGDHPADAEPSDKKVL
ncbi:DUF4097 domain-containing protein [Streptomyces sp. A7024]|uniref:DUF4097 domain-containing protein n=1 Tax=Streptomyces coryli TaxID=1128680 RepID=A0A6G4U530_9ACTN|nr:DUF4097 family beta strand repeat-containing protein [Streptomyces coryli]NGN67284.1 DUF4097 domain-containing protein [Streptomyces coryli]